MSNDILTVTEVVNSVTVTPVNNTVTVSGVGTQGPAGTNGTNGTNGATGATGAKGDTGDTGSSGVVSVNAPITNAGTSTAANLSVSTGTTSAVGVLQLTNSTSSTSTTTAATPNAVKSAYDSAIYSNAPFTTGYYYRTPSAAGIAGAGTAVANTTYYHPFFVAAPTTFDRIMVRGGTTFSGTASVRLGIYNATSGKPSTVLLDAGTVAVTASTQIAEITINQTLQAGFYFLAANSQTAASTNTYYAPQAATNSSYIGQPATSSFTTVVYYTQASVTGAFATAGAVSDGTTTAGILTMVRAA